MTLAQMSVNGAVMIGVVVLIRRIGLYHLPKRTFLLFWDIVLLRLLLPLALPLPWPVAGERGLPPTLDVQEWLTVGEAVPINSPVMVEAGLSNDLGSWLGMLAMVGTLVCAAYFIRCYSCCQREFRMSLPAEQAIIQRWLDNHVLRRRIEVRISDRLAAPLTYGYWHPVILLPKGLDYQNERQLDYILEHEYVHICRLDNVRKVLLTAALCLHWFNPLVWLMVILANRDIELACDESVLRHYNGDRRADYALTLISLAKQQSHTLQLYSQFNQHSAEERIEAIMKITKKSGMASVISLVLTAGLLLGLAPDTKAAEAFLPGDLATNPLAMTPSGQTAKDLLPADLEMQVFADTVEDAKTQTANDDTQTLALTWPCPSGMTVTATYGERVHPITGEKIVHSGIDIGAIQGANIVAAAGGQVLAVDYDSTYGNYVLIDHGGKLSTFYGNLSEVAVKEGDTLSVGQTIGQAGSTGKSTGAHLHFEIRQDNKAIDPSAFLGL